MNFCQAINFVNDMVNFLDLMYFWDIKVFIFSSESIHLLENIEMMIIIDKLFECTEDIINRRISVVLIQNMK